MTPEQKARIRNRTAALSVLRACDRADIKNTPQVAKVHGSTLMVLPEETHYLRKQYEPWLGTPRKTKSQSKSAVYQRNYRLRKKSQQTPSDDPLFLDACRAAGVRPYDKEASLIYLTLQFHKARLNSGADKRLPGIYSSVKQPDELEHETPKLRELKQPVFGSKSKYAKPSQTQRHPLSNTTPTDSSNSSNPFSTPHHSHKNIFDNPPTPLQTRSQTLYENEPRRHTQLRPLGPR